MGTSATHLTAGDGAPPVLYERPHWFACRTRARSEKAADRLLEERGVERYLPLVEKERQWADRVKTVAFPLFPGYLFARFTLTDLGDVLRTPRVISVVRVNGYPTPVREEELESVRRLVEGASASGREPEPADYLQPGDPVVVTEGPFEGMRGILLEARGRARVAVRLHAIRQATSVELDRSVMRPLDEDPHFF